MPVSYRAGVLPSLITTCIIQPFQAQEPPEGTLRRSSSSPFEMMLEV